MKKIALLLILCFVAVGIFAQQYTVQNVVGSAFLETRPNNWVPIQIGDKLNDHSVVRTGLNSQLVLEKIENGQPALYIISSMNTGMIIDIFHAKNRVRIGGTVAQTDTSTVRRSTVNIGTASARASDAAADVEFQE